MTLQEWADNGWLRAHQTSSQEMANLLDIVDRDLVDACAGISADWRFGIAYNAALKVCTILLYASGYRTIQALPIILGSERKKDAEYLEACRKKRNIVEYDYVGGVTQGDADELIEFTKDLREAALQWLRENHPQLISA